MAVAAALAGAAAAEADDAQALLLARERAWFDARGRCRPAGGRTKAGGVAGGQLGQAVRLLDLHGLMSLTLERRLADRFAPELRRTLFDAVARNARNRVSLEGGFLTIDLSEPR